jgi:hypothetical protein
MGKIFYAFFLTNLTRLIKSAAVIVTHRMNNLKQSELEIILSATLKRPVNDRRHIFHREYDALLR